LSTGAVTDCYSLCPSFAFIRTATEALRVLHKPPGGNFGKGAARFKGVDKVAVLMKKLEDAEYMAGWILDLPSVSSDATTTNTKKNDT
jgi:hypothetical protein